jgi:hypothetical protein
VECTWFWSWEHDKSLNKGQQDLTKLNTKQAMYVEGLYPKSMHMALVGIYHHWGVLWHYGFIIFYQKQILQARWLEPVGFLS